MNLKKWKLVSVRDVSPSSWFPVEARTYQLPNGRIVDDFTVTTLPDVAMIVAITPDEKIVLVKQYKQGFDDIILEFPAGRVEPEHASIDETAIHELEEETGIKAEKVEQYGMFAGFVTKSTEKVFCYFVETAEFNSQQNLDENEEIEVVLVTFDELENMISDNQINAALTIAAWDLAKRKYSHKFSTWHT